MSEFNKYMENLRKKNQTETLEIKISLNQIKKKHSGRPLQQTRSGRQDLST
jgi:hypothetical protein